MNKTIKMNMVALISLFVVIAFVFNGCTNADSPLAENEKSEKALKYYKTAVEKTKNEKNFDLKLTTSVSLKEFDCSVSIFDSVLKKAFDHRLGDIEDSVDVYHFVDGILKEDKTIIPYNIIQPANSDINPDLFDGIKFSRIYYEGDIEKVRLVIAEEQKSVDEVMAVFTSLAEEVGNNYDIRKDYPQVNALAKYHSNFIDLMSVAPRITELMSINNNHEHDPNDTVPNYGEFGKTTKIEDGVIYLGDTMITVDFDDDSRLSKVIINAPIGVDVNVRIIQNNFKAIARFMVSQTYEFSYVS